MALASRATAEAAGVVGAGIEVFYPTHPARIDMLGRLLQDCSASSVSQREDRGGDAEAEQEQRLMMQEDQEDGSKLTIDESPAESTSSTADGTSSSSSNSVKESVLTMTETHTLFPPPSKVSTSESRAQREESAAALRLYQERCLLRTMCRALTDTLSIDMNDMIPPFLRATGNKSEAEVAAATAAASMVGSQGGTKLAFARPFVPPTQVPVWPGRCQRDSSSGGGAADSEDGEGKRVELIWSIAEANSPNPNPTMSGDASAFTKRNVFNFLREHASEAWLVERDMHGDAKAVMKRIKLEKLRFLYVEFAAAFGAAQGTADSDADHADAAQIKELKQILNVLLDVVDDEFSVNLALGDDEVLAEVAGLVAALQDLLTGACDTDVEDTSWPSPMIGGPGGKGAGGVRPQKTLERRAFGRRGYDEDDESDEDEYDRRDPYGRTPAASSPNAGSEGKGGRAGSGKALAKRLATWRRVHRGARSTSRYLLVDTWQALRDTAASAKSNQAAQLEEQKQLVAEGRQKASGPGAAPGELFRSYALAVLERARQKLAELAAQASRVADASGLRRNSDDAVGSMLKEVARQAGHPLLTTLVPSVAATLTLWGGQFPWAFGQSLLRTAEGVVRGAQSLRCSLVHFKDPADALLELSVSLTILSGRLAGDAVQHAAADVDMDNVPEHKLFEIGQSLQSNLITQSTTGGAAPDPGRVDWSGLTSAPGQTPSANPLLADAMSGGGTVPSSLTEAVLPDSGGAGGQGGESKAPDGPSGGAETKEGSDGVAQASESKEGESKADGDAISAEDSATLTAWCKSKLLRGGLLRDDDMTTRNDSDLLAEAAAAGGGQPYAGGAELLFADVGDDLDQAAKFCDDYIECKKGSPMAALEKWVKQHAAGKVDHAMGMQRWLTKNPEVDRARRCVIAAMLYHSGLLGIAALSARWLHEVQRAAAEAGSKNASQQQQDMNDVETDTLPSSRLTDIWKQAMVMTGTWLRKNRATPKSCAATVTRKVAFLLSLAPCASADGDDVRAAGEDERSRLSSAIAVREAEPPVAEMKAAVEEKAATPAAKPNTSPRQGKVKHWKRISAAVHSVARWKAAFRTSRHHATSAEERKEIAMEVSSFVTDRITARIVRLRRGMEVAKITAFRRAQGYRGIFAVTQSLDQWHNENTARVDRVGGGGVGACAEDAGSVSFGPVRVAFLSQLNRGLVRGHYSGGLASCGWSSLSALQHHSGTLYVDLGGQLRDACRQLQDMSAEARTEEGGEDGETKAAEEAVAGIGDEGAGKAKGAAKKNALAVQMVDCVGHLMVLMEIMGVTVEPRDHEMLCVMRLFNVLQEIMAVARPTVPALVDSEDGSEGAAGNAVVVGGSVSDGIKRHVGRSAMKLLYLLASQVAIVREEDARNSVLAQSMKRFGAGGPTGGSGALLRHRSGPEALGQSVFEVLFAELSTLLNHQEASPATQTASGGVGAGGTAALRTIASSEVLEDMTSLLVAVSAAKVCQGYLATKPWLSLLLRLIAFGPVEIQRRIPRILRRVLPSMSPTAFEVDIPPSMMDVLDEGQPAGGVSQYPTQTSELLVRAFLRSVAKTLLPPPAKPTFSAEDAAAKVEADKATAVGSVLDGCSFVIASEAVSQLRCLLRSNGQWRSVVGDVMLQEFKASTQVLQDSAEATAAAEVAAAAEAAETAATEVATKDDDEKKSGDAEDVDGSGSNDMAATAAGAAAAEGPVDPSLVVRTHRARQLAVLSVMGSHLPGLRAGASAWLLGEGSDQSGGRRSDGSMDDALLPPRSAHQAKQGLCLVSEWSRDTGGAQVCMVQPLQKGPRRESDTDADVERSVDADLLRPYDRVWVHPAYLPSELCLMVLQSVVATAADSTAAEAKRVAEEEARAKKKEEEDQAKLDAEKAKAEAKKAKAEEKEETEAKETKEETTAAAGEKKQKDAENDASTEKKKAAHMCMKSHPLEVLGTSNDNGWSCSGMTLLPGGCKKGCTGFNQTKGWERWRCALCDFDLCESCLEARPVPRTPEQEKTEAAEQLAKTNKAMADRHEQLCSSLSELHMYKTAHALLLHKPYASSMQRGLAAAGGSEGACKFRQDILRLACSSGKGSGAADPYTPSPGQTTGLQSLGKC